MNKIIYKFYKRDQSFLFQILHMDESFRADSRNSTKQYQPDRLHFKVLSQAYPQISIDQIFLRGNSLSDDKYISSIDFMPVEYRHRNIETYENLVDKSILLWSKEWDGWNKNKEKFYERTALRLNYE